MPIKPTRAVNPRGQGARLRGDILNAASELLAATTERDAVTLRAIARRAGIAAPSIYPHFADRDAVLDAVVEESFDRLHEALTAAIADQESPTAELHALARAYLQFADENPGRYRILFGRSQANLAADQHAYPHGLAAFELLNSALQRSTDAGTSTSTNAHADASSLWAALHGLVLLRPATPGFPWPDADDLLTRTVNGLAHLTPPP